jgi:hypothetical protein
MIDLGATDESSGPLAGPACHGPNPLATKLASITYGPRHQTKLSS